MTGEHTAEHELGNDYPGCYCIYCGVRVADIKSDEYGQIFLERGSRRKYVAVVSRDRQRAVESLSLDQGRARVTFKGDREPTHVDTTALLKAFQDGEEVLIVQ